MIKILFVCHGNICRSPMAESIFRSMLEARGLTERIGVDSAAVSREELGNPVYPQAQTTLTRHGLPRSDHRARQVGAADYDRYDFFLCMDEDNYARLIRIFGGDPKRKCGMLLGYTEYPREVEDPWYTGRFERVFEEITEGCEAFLEELLRDEARRRD